ncbi:hypothetical protein ACOMHN_021242 [Nucella lapillus]
MVGVYLRDFVLLLLCGILGNAFGATLSPCGEDNTAEIVEGRRVNTFTCTGLANGQQVDWTVLYNQTPSSAASCPAGSTSSTHCTMGDLGATFTASRVSGTESRVVVDPTVLNKKEYVQYGTLKCANQNSNGDSCQMDYIVPVGGTCSIQTGTGPSQFRLDGKCNLNAGAKSSRKRFKCVWLRSGDGDPWQQNVVLNENNYQSECKLTNDIPTDPGVYTYRVQLFPGLSTVTAGTVQIAKPEAPTLSGCGGEGYVRENTNVTCTCSTNAIGQPQGRLQWVKIGDSSVKKEGSYGASSLTVSLMLVRLDHQSTQFRCNLDWETEILGTTVKFNVGYPPKKVFCGINRQQNDVIVNEYQSVRFRCQKDDGRPDPSLSLVKKDNNTVLLTNTSLLIHVVVSRCEDSGQYQCTADNGMGPKDLGDVNFINDPVSTTFDVTAYPAPTQVTFTFLGPTGNSTQPSAADESQIQLAGSCQAIAGGAIYLFTCTVTVNKLTSETAAGVYEVKVTNSRGNGLFRLKVLYKAPVTPAPNKGGGGEGANLGGIIGGVIGVVVAIAVIIIVIFFIMKRRKDPVKKKLQSSTGTNVHNDIYHDSHHGELDNPAHEADPENATHSAASSAKPHKSSDIEAAPRPEEGVFAGVNKPEKPAAAAATAAEVVGAEAVYAEVDKTKKKKKNAGKKAPAPAKKAKGKKARQESEGHIYGNVESQTKGDKHQKGKKSPALPMEETRVDTGLEANADGLLYTSMDFTGVSASSDPPRKPSLSDQGVLYSDVDFSRFGNAQR